MADQPSRWERVERWHTGYFWRYEPPGLGPWIVAAIGLLALALIHGTLTRTSIEDDLAARARVALDRAGAQAVAVDFAGRDGTLRGEPPAGVSAEVLADKVRTVTGARVVSFAAVTPG